MYARTSQGSPFLAAKHQVPFVFRMRAYVWLARDILAGVYGR